MNGLGKFGWSLMVCAFLVLTGCAEKRFAAINQPEGEIEGCSEDSDCPEGFICVQSECVPIDEFDCTGDTLPRILVEPSVVDFGNVIVGESATQTVTVINDSECNLNLDAAGFSSDTAPGFSCEPCDIGSYPQTIAPRRSFEIETSYAPISIGENFGTLQIRSDAGNTGENGIIEVELIGRYSGAPVLVLDPLELDFGYVAFTAGQGGATRTESVKIMNQGTGNASLLIEEIYLPRGTDFSIPEEFSSIRPSNPTVLPPYDEADPETWIEVPITLEPTNNLDHENDLFVVARPSEEEEAIEVSVALTGSSKGPPRIQVTPDELIFETAAGDPLPLGRTEYRSVTVSNIGQSDLRITPDLDDPTGDYTFSPTVVPPLPPGGTMVFSILYTPTQPSDPFNPENPQRSADAFFRIESNDTEQLLSTVDLRGYAVSGLADDFLTIEMSFLNNASNWAQNDFRDVDVILEAPGRSFFCRKPILSDQQGWERQDVCEMWNDSGIYGSTQWLAVGANEEPERILLYGLGQDLANNQTFSVNVEYMEDCANIPTSLVADLAGVGVSVLLGILGGQVGVPITVDPGTLSDLIGSQCYDKTSSTVTVSVFVNGNEVASQQVTLRNKGDLVEAVKIRRSNGQFSIVP